MTFEGLDFLPLTAEHIPLLTPVMKRAFDDDAMTHAGKPEGGPEGYDDGSFLYRWGLHPDATAYSIWRGGTPIGAMILFVHPQAASGHLGCLFIDAPLIGHGYGSTAWRFAESTYPDIITWTVETPAISFRNHCFYINKCGFHVVGVEGRDRFDAQFRLKKTISR